MSQIRHPNDIHIQNVEYLGDGDFVYTDQGHRQVIAFHTTFLADQDDDIDHHMLDWATFSFDSLDEDTDTLRSAVENLKGVYETSTRSFRALALLMDDADANTEKCGSWHDVDRIIREIILKEN